jgi:hypothetical protein
MKFGEQIQGPGDFGNARSARFTDFNPKSEIRNPQSNVSLDFSG